MTGHVGTWNSELADAGELPAAVGIRSRLQIFEWSGEQVGRWFAELQLILQACAAVGIVASGALVLVEAFPFGRICVGYGRFREFPRLPFRDLFLHVAAAQIGGVGDGI